MTPFLNLVHLSSRNMNNHKGRRTSMKTHSLDPAFLLLIGCNKVLFSRLWHVDHSRVQRLFNKAMETSMPGLLHHHHHHTQSGLHLLAGTVCKPVCVCVCVILFCCSQEHVCPCVCLFVSWNLALLGERVA